MNTIIELLKSIFAYAGYLSSDKERFPSKLTEDEEKMYIQLMKQGDSSARDKLIEHNMRLTAHIAKKYAHGQELEDYISIGSIGLIKGVNTFNITKGKLSSYLSKCIENEILMYLRTTKKQLAEVSLCESIGEDKDGNSISLIDILSGDALTEECVEISVLTEKLLLLIDKILTKRERSIIILRYGLYGNSPLPQRIIAKKLNISRSYVSRIEKKALLKLKKAIDK